MLLDKSDLIDNIKTELSDNSAQAIEPYHIRHNFLDIIDSTASLLKDIDVNSKNYKTPQTRSTAAGQFAIERINFNNYTSVDNSAFGFSSLRSNYQGARNTSVGSQTLYSNIHGSDNIAIGYSSSYAVTNGSSNVSLGNYSLLSNRTGNNNIAIGHGAGYYAGPSDNYKFYLGSSQIDNTSICADPDGDSVTPLFYGDLLNNRLAVNSKEITNTAVLQTSGNIAPVVDDTYTLGLNNFYWNAVRVKNVNFSETHKFSYDNDVRFNFNIIPENGSTVSIGSIANPVEHIHTNNINANTIDFIHSSNYSNKTLNLASQDITSSLDGGGPNGLYDYIASEETSIASYLSDNELDGAGFKIHSSDGDRSYELLFVSSDASQTQFTTLDPYARSHWKSNISLEIPDSGYLRSSTILAQEKFSVLGSDSSLILSSGYIYVGDQSLESSTYKTGTNFVQPESLALNLYTAGSGNIKQCFLNNFDSYQAARGFEIESVYGSSARLEIKSYTVDSDHPLFPANQVPDPVNQMILRRDQDAENILTITDSPVDISSDVIKDSTVYISSEGPCSVSVNSPNDKSSTLNLSTKELTSSISLSEDDSHVVLSYEDTQSLHYNDKYINILNNVSGTKNFTVNIGDAVNPDVSLGLRNVDNDPVSASGYSAIFAKEKSGANQSSTIMFVDSVGNYFDLIKGQYDGIMNLEGKNAFGGVDTPVPSTDYEPEGNVGIGESALKSLTGGSRNTVLGSFSAKDVTSGYNNIVLGSESLQNVSDKGYNICIGNNLGNSIDSDYNFILGLSDSLPLMRGKLGPSATEKMLELPNRGNLKIQNVSNTQSLNISSDEISLFDGSGSDYPESQLDITFEGNKKSTLLKLDHSDAPLDKYKSYDGSDGPSVEVMGHLKVLGSIKFANGSVLDAGPIAGEKTLKDVEDELSDVKQDLSDLVVEGSASSEIDKMQDSNNPHSGSVSLRLGGSVTVVNRDPHRKINQGDYVVAIKIGNEYRPISVSSQFNAVIQC